MAVARSAPARPPDILLVTIEHLPARAVGCYGSPYGATPQIDRLAAEGTVFRHCTVASPLCVPSRTAMFTGRYPSLTGCRDNTALLPPHEVHLPALLSAAGYVCGLFGKNHCFPDPAAAGFAAYLSEDGVRARLRAAWGQPWPAPPVPVAPELLAAQPRRFRWGEHPLPIWSGGRYPAAPEAAPARANVDAALAFLNQHRDVPTFTWLSFYDPHPPFRPPAPYDTRFDPAAFALPPPDDLTAKPAIQQVYYHGAWHYLMDEAQVRLAMALYYGTLAYVDDCLGLLFDALRAQGRLDEMVVVVHGDHGEFLGEHGLSRKCAAFYDSITQVPFIVRGLPEASSSAPAGGAPDTPSRAARSGESDVLVELVDLCPTLLDVAGVPAPPPINGRSLLPVLLGDLPGRTSTYAEVGSRRPRPPGGPRAALREALAGATYDRPLAELPLVESGTFFLSRGRMVRTSRWKYCHYVDDSPELYDLHADPWEVHNLAGCAAYQAQEEAMRRLLLERTIEAGDPR